MLALISRKFRPRSLGARPAAVNWGIRSGWRGERSETAQNTGGRGAYHGALATAAHRQRIKRRTDSGYSGALTADTAAHRQRIQRRPDSGGMYNGETQGREMLCLRLRPHRHSTSDDPGPAHATRDGTKASAAASVARCNRLHRF